MSNVFYYKITVMKVMCIDTYTYLFVYKLRCVSPQFVHCFIIKILLLLNANTCICILYIYTNTLL